MVGRLESQGTLSAYLPSWGDSKSLVVMLELPYCFLLPTLTPILTEAYVENLALFVWKKFWCWFARRDI